MQFLWAGVQWAVAIGMAVLAWYTWQQRERMVGATQFAVLAGLGAAWSALYGVEVLLNTLAGRLVLAQLQLTVLQVIPVVWVIFALAYAGQGRFIAYRNLFLMFLVPVTAVVVVWDQPETLWGAPQLVESFGLLTLDRGPTAMYHLLNVYNLLVVSMGIGFLLRARYKTPRLLRNQVTAMVAAAVFGVAGFAAYVFRAPFLPDVDWSALSFAVTLGVGGYALHRLQYFDVLSLAPGLVVDKMLDGIIVLDRREIVTEMNPAAARMVDVRSVDALGKRIGELLGKLEEGPAMLQYLKVKETQDPLMVRIEDRQIPRFYNMYLSWLYDDDGLALGRMMMLQDITYQKQIEEEVRRQAQQLRTAANVSRAVTSFLDLDGLLTTLVSMVQDEFGYYAVSVWLLPDDRDRLVMRAGVGPTGPMKGHVLELTQKSIITNVANTGKRRLVNDVARVGDFMKWDVLPNTLSELAVPVRLGTRVEGVLDVQSEQALGFSDSDVVLFKSLADQLAVAIKNAATYEQESRRRHLVENLYDIGRALSGTLDLERVLDLVLGLMHDLVPYDRAAVMVRDGDILEFVAAAGFPEDVDLRSLRVSIMARDVFEEIYRTRRPLALDEVDRRADWQHIEPLPKARSWLGLPLIRNDDVIGMLSLTREHKDAYSEEEIALAATFAGQAAIAFENARLYDQITRFNAQLERRVQERTDELRKALKQLEKLDKAKSDFISVASHELRTPLTVMSGYNQMLLMNEVILKNAYLKQIAEGFQMGTTRLHEIVSSMLDVAKLSGPILDLYFEPVPLHDVVQAAYGMVTKEMQLANRSLVVIVDDMRGLPPLEGDFEVLKKVMYHLIINAVKYTPDGGYVRVSGRSLPADDNPLGKDALEVVVRDTGIGIDPDMHEQIFMKFTQTSEVSLHSSGKAKFRGGGPGLGLAIVRGFVEAHSGMVWVSSPGHNVQTLPGSQFFVLLPQRVGRGFEDKGTSVLAMDEESQGD